MPKVSDANPEAGTLPYLTLQESVRNASRHWPSGACTPSLICGFTYLAGILTSQALRQRHHNPDNTECFEPGFAQSVVGGRGTAGLA